MSAVFSGAKIALLNGDDVLTYLRDDTSTIPFPNRWDLPGGGREGDETPEACALRELEEEFSLKVPETRIHWRKSYPNTQANAGTTWFFAADLMPEEIDAIRFGEEGQFWQMMTVEAFIAHDRAVPHLQDRLKAYLRGI